MNAHARHIDDVLPHNIEAEQALLGALFLNNDAFFAIDDLLQPDHFYEPVHRQIYELACGLVRAGKAANPITMKSFLPADADIGGMSAAQYLARLTAEATTVVNAPDYARTIRDLSDRRALIGVCEHFSSVARAVAVDTPAERLMEDAGAEIESIRHGKQIDGVKTIAEAAHAALRQTSDAFRKHVKPGYSTGIETVDDLLGPIMPGHLFTLLGASGNGKTAFAAQIITHVTRGSLDTQASTTGVFVSQEMTAPELARREMATMTGISTVRQMRGEVTPAEYEILADAGRALSDLKIMIDQSGRQPVSRIVRKLRALKRRHNIGFAVVDHLLLIAPEHQRMTKIETIENASAALKDVAKELDISILLLAQVTREAQKRDNWRIRDTDLYGGDAVKQNSDVLASIAIPRKFLIQREPDSEDSKAHDKWQRLMTKWDGKAEIGALKVRDGEDGGYRELKFDGNRVRFVDMV